MCKIKKGNKFEKCDLKLVLTQLVLSGKKITYTKFIICRKQINVTNK